jgi:spore cortex formation protein SpoVR/YcgB (stage V sporulation)
MNYDQYSKGYEWGLQKIYEMVINTNPAYAYLMSFEFTCRSKDRDGSRLWTR